MINVRLDFVWQDPSWKELLFSKLGNTISNPRNTWWYLRWHNNCICFLDNIRHIPNLHTTIFDTSALFCVSCYHTRLSRHTSLTHKIVFPRLVPNMEFLREGKRFKSVTRPTWLNLHDQEYSFIYAWINLKITSTHNAYKIQNIYKYTLKHINILDVKWIFSKTFCKFHQLKT